jgi:hypothetical protein
MEDMAKLESIIKGVNLRLSYYFFLCFLLSSCLPSTHQTEIYKKNIAFEEKLQNDLSKL